jgi:hypothetical protein
MTPRWSHRLNLIASAVVLAGLMAAPAFAQGTERPLMFDGHYRFGRLSDGAGTNIPFGGGASLSRAVQTNDNGSIDVFGEFDWQRKGYTTSGCTGSTCSSTENMGLFMAGLRWYAEHPKSTVSPFVAVGLGITRDSFSQGSFSDSETGLTFLVRGGVSKKMNDNHSIFFDGYWERISLSSAINEYGFELGFFLWLSKASS